MSAGEYLHWVDAGCWNLAGDPRVMQQVGVFRQIAGERGWMLAAAGMDPAEALTQFYAHGAAAVLASAQVMLALENPQLAGLLESGSEEGDGALGVSESHSSPHSRLDFS